MAGLASLASKMGIGGAAERRTAVVVSQLSDDGSPIQGSNSSGGAGGQEDGTFVMNPLAFQYFPETLTDTKQVNYQRKDIPGGGLPIYQWVNSGERSIAFSAYLACDNNLLDPSGSSKNSDLADRQKQTGTGNRNIDIRSAIAWLRHFMLPQYVDGGSEVGVPLSKAPPRILLTILNSGIGVAGGGLAGDDSIFCYMAQCDVTHQAFFQNGFPRLAVVQLAFIEIGQVGGVVRFPSSGQLVQDAVGANGNYLGYGLTNDFGTGG